MNSILLTIAAFLVLALSAVFAVPYFVDWTAYRDVFEAQAARLVGRAVQVGGDVQLRLLPAPVLRFEHVKVADAEGGFAQPFAAARSFTMRLSVPPLLRGAVKARTIDLDHPVVNLRIDDNGKGNWRDVGRGDASLRFVPREVGLGSVRIANATVSLSGSPGAAPLVFEGLSGKLKARSLKGPYKFEGQLRYGGAKREFRFSTGRREPDGSVRLKGLVRDPLGRQTYAVDGALRAFATEPRFDGRLSVRVTDRSPPAGTPTKLAVPPIELKSELNVDLTRAVLDNLELTIRRGGRPQTIAGRFEAHWKQGLAVDGSIRGRWLDLDSLLADSGESLAPGKAIPALSDWALGKAAIVRSGRLRMAIEQAVFARDLVHALDVDISISDGGLRLNRLAGRLPGENRLALEGSVRGGESGPEFSGHARLNGRRLSRLVRWAGLEGARLGPADETGDFAIEADVMVDRQQLGIENARGDLLGTAFRGAFRYQTGARRAFALELDSDRLDLSRVLGPSVSLGALLKRLARGSNRDDAAVGDGPAAGWLEDAEARLDLRAGTVVLPGFGEGSMTAKLRLADGELDIRTFDLRAANGVKLRAEGRLAGIAERPDGKLTLVVDAANADGLEALATLMDLPDAGAEGGRLAMLAPLNVVATVESGDRQARELKFNIAGSAGRGDVGISGSYAGDVSSFREGRIAARGTLRNDDGKAMIRLIFPELEDAALARFAAGKGLLSVTASGVLASSLESRIVLEAGGLRWLFDGESIWTEAGFALTGRTTLQAHDAAAALALIDVSTSAGHAGVPLDLHGQLIKSADSFRIEDLGGRIGDQAVDGKVRVQLREPRPVVEATVAVAEAALPRLLAPALAWDRDGASGPPAVRGVTATQSFWPDKRFNLTVLGAIDGRLHLTARRLRLAESIVMTDATLEARLDAGRLAVPSLVGDLYGGRFRASASLARRGSGMVFLAKSEARGLRLEQATRFGGAPALASGSLDLEISVGGEGLTPRALATGLTGEGRLAFAAGTVHHLSPKVLRRFARARGRRPADTPPEKLDAVLTAELKQSEFAFAPLTTTFVVRNGTARIKKLTLSSDDGEAAINTYLDIAGIRLDSEWVLALPDGANAAGGPQVTLAFAGSLLDFGRIQPDVDTQALRRYITMRRMEQDVERLERLDVQGRGRAGATASTRKTPAARRRPAGRPEPRQPADGRAAALRKPPAGEAPPALPSRNSARPAARARVAPAAPRRPPADRVAPRVRPLPPAVARREPTGRAGTRPAGAASPPALPPAAATPPWQTQLGAPPPGRRADAPARPQAQRREAASTEEPRPRPPVRRRPPRGADAFQEFSD